MQFRKKPVVIEAFQFKQPTGVGDAPEWLVEAVMRNDFLVVDGVAHITALEGIMTAQPGDWIIRGIKGEIYPCKPEIFAATYESVCAPSSSHPAEGERQSAPTPRVEAVIADAMEKYAGGTPGRDLTYYQNVHQDLAPLARQLERELDRTKAELTELRVQMARSAGDAVPAGFKLVPVEPTEEMLRVQLAVEWPATYRDFLRHPASGEKTKADTEKEIAKAKKRWTAMLAAAPASANTTPARAESACRCRAQGGSTSESSNESCAATPTNTAPAVQPEKVAELWNQQADEFNQWSELGADEKAEWIAKLSWDSANEGAKGDQQ